MTLDTVALAAAMLLCLAFGLLERHGLISRWVEQGRAWRYFVYMLAITLPVALIIAVLVTVISLGHGRTEAFECAAATSLTIAALTTRDHQKRKRAQAERAAARTHARET